MMKIFKICRTGRYTYFGPTQFFGRGLIRTFVPPSTSAILLRIHGTNFHHCFRGSAGRSLDTIMTFDGFNGFLGVDYVGVTPNLTFT